ncbi:tRNA uridine-5-carboxymethylaminomethyl(34) synthesis GTPase MnmE [bacterium]|nr:tRNA uridine-5-carboxymethylaminomethyl(34) synthesis GTPase MnmE [bacterium]
MFNDAIVAISTPSGEGGIGIVRLSGKNVIARVEELFQSSNKGKTLSTVPSHTVHYGYIYPDQKGKGEILDQALVTIMRAPHTYTGEDIVEISCHGGTIPVKKILEACLKKGLRLADPGEFTKRAFLNGRIDLIQAEAVCDIIRAKTELSLSSATKQLKGSLSNKVNSIWQKIFDLTAHLEALLDFAQEDIPQLNSAEMLKNIDLILAQIEDLIATTFTGKILSNGLKTTFIGKPNVGKSSLLNALLEDEQVIVSSTPGTTRDAIEKEINISGLLVKITDTAGIKSSGQNEIEEKSIKQSKKSIQSADLILLVLDSSGNLTKEDFSILSELSLPSLEKKIIVVANKCDLKQKFTEEKIKSLFSFSPPIIKTSATRLIGINKLKELIYSLFINENIAVRENTCITNIRHKNILLQTKKFIILARDSIIQEQSEEFISMDMRNALNSLGELTGKNVSADLLEKIFSTFCIGK